MVLGSTVATWPNAIPVSPEWRKTHITSKVRMGQGAAKLDDIPGGEITCLVMLCVVLAVTGKLLY